jgi:hypothetical protein
VQQARYATALAAIVGAANEAIGARGGDVTFLAAAERAHAFGYGRKARGQEREKEGWRRPLTFVQSRAVGRKAEDR